MHITRVEATPKSGPGLRDVRGDVVRRQLSADHNLEFTGVKTIVGFLINSDISHEEITARADDLFADPIIEHSITNQSFLGSNEIFSQTPDAVVSVVQVFPFDDSSTNNLFDLRYQIRLNDLYDFSSTSIIQYQMTMQQLDFLSHILLSLIHI